MSEEEQTAGQTILETFDSGYKELMAYCEWVLSNQMKLDIHEKLMGKEQPSFYDEGLIEMDLELKI